MSINCAYSLADLFLYSYEAEFIQNLVKQKKISVPKTFNFAFRYIDDVLSLNNSKFRDYLPMIYPPELEIKETTETASSALYLDIILEFDSNGHLSTSLYDKRDDSEISKTEESDDDDALNSDDEILYNAVAILKRDIDRIGETYEYPNAHERFISICSTIA